MRKWLILAHRYLGIGLSLLFVVWFASGIVMMYAGGMPRLTPELRLERLPELDFTRVELTATEAAERVADAPSGRVALLTVMGRPAYRFPGRTPTVVFADTGDRLARVDVNRARTIASTFLGQPERDLEFVRTLTRPDQWTLTERQWPLHKFRAADAAATEVYVSPVLGEVTVLTTRRSRFLAWIGTIPHWLYFAALRLNQPLWYKLVVWAAALGCALAVMGLVLGVLQFRRRRPFRLATAVPYSGWMRWHYVTGVVFGVFTLTWVFSGLLSMEPFAWTNAEGLTVRGDVFTGGPVDLSRFPRVDATAWDRALAGRGVKEIEMARIQDEPYYVVRLGAAPPPPAGKRERLHQPYYITGRTEPDRVLMAADTLQVRQEPFSAESLVARLQGALPDVPIVESTLLSDYDSYYYSRQGRSPLPVLRVKFGDPMETWFYIDPETSQLLGTVHRLNRVERWLYNGLHSLDFAFWYNSRLWDVGVILLSLGGLATSAIGFWVGIKRLGRNLLRLPASVASPGRVAEPSGAMTPEVGTQRRSAASRAP